MKKCASAWIFAVLPACSGSSPDVEPPPAAEVDVPILEKSLEEVGLSSEALDPSADPCVDFYQFACGGWIQSTQIPGDESRWVRSFNVIQKENQELLDDVLKDAAARLEDAESSEDPTMRKLGEFYGACMDQAAVDAAGVKPIRPYLDLILNIETKEDVAQAIIALHQRGIWAGWDISAVQDFKEATRVIAYVDQNGLGLPDRGYYFDEDKADVREEYKGHVARMFRAAGFSERRARVAVGHVWGLEVKMAEASLPRVDRRDPDKLYHPADRARLREVAPAVPWKKYLASLELADVESFNITHPPFFEMVNELMTNTSIEAWRHYLAWHLLDATAPTLSSELDREAFAFKKVLTGQEEQKPRWKRCVEATDAALGHLLAQPFIERRFAGDSKAAAQSYVQAISEAFRANLATLDWMDDETRAAAEGKLDKVAFLIGYPPEWDEYTFPVDGLYGENYLVARQWHVADDLAQIGEPVDRTRWEMTPPTVNAYYHPLKNQMVFPAGILQHPFYDVESGVAVNLGAMGMVVGHELTHGFDDKGSKFDGDGNLSKWWPEDVRQAFEERTQCVVKQYERYEALPGLTLNGELTLGENIADIGGLKLAFAAYRDLREGEHEAVVADGFTEDQQFFLANAQIWCSKIREAEAKRRVQVDPHSPPRFRVNGAMANLPEFGEAFACEVGSPMRPEDICSVW
jgi:putative endopeptidase